MIKSDHANHKNTWWYKMVARSGKSIMNLVRLPILRPLLLSVRFCERLKVRQIQRICMAGW